MATVGSYCVHFQEGEGSSDVEHGTTCADKAYPLRTRKRLAARPRAVVNFDTKPPARRVRVGLLRVRGDDISAQGRVRNAVAADAEGRKWRYRFPRRLGRATTLELDVDYPDGGDANFWVGIRRTPTSCR